MRLTIVCNQILPYRTPVFDALAREPGVEVEVLYLSEREGNRLWEVAPPAHPHVILPGFSAYVRSRDWPVHVTRGVTAALARFAPDAVVTMGYDSPAFWQAAWWARRRGKARVLYMGSTAYSSRSRGGLVAWLRRRFVRGADAYLAYGTWARDYLLQLGADGDDVFLGMNTVDVAGVAALVAAAEPMPRAAAHELLFVGQLVPRKGADVLIEALALIDADWRLHIAGAGPQEARLRRMVRSRGLAARVVFHGYCQPEALAPLQAGCDVLVMPSAIEVWGLVVNEALAAGLFVVAGQTAGAVADLLRPGENGYAADVSRPERLAAVVQRAMFVPKDRAAIRATVAPFTPERTAAELAQAARHALFRAARRDVRAAGLVPQ
jgi:glycosyltransferase involved in cell wall biosynthesis